MPTECCGRALAKHEGARAGVLPWRWILVSLVAALQVACQTSTTPPEPVPVSEEISFTESVAAPVKDSPRHLRADGYVTLRISSEDPVRVTAAEAVTAAGVQAEVMGFSDCLNGCSGSARALSPKTKRFTERSISHPMPTDLEQGLSMVLHIWVPSGRIRADCAVVEAARLTLEGGEEVLARFSWDDGPIAALRIEGRTKSCL